MLRVFVYGTLKPGHANYQAYCGHHVLEVCKAKVRGKLFDLPMGYPAMTSGSDWVKGYLLHLDSAAVLKRLDVLEDYCPNRAEAQNEYIRKEVEVFDVAARSLGCAWAYFMTLQNVQRLHGKWLVNGQWR